MKSGCLWMPKIFGNKEIILNDLPNIYTLYIYFTIYIYIYIYIYILLNIYLKRNTGSFNFQYYHTLTF